MRSIVSTILNTLPAMSTTMPSSSEIVAWFELNGPATASEAAEGLRYHSASGLNTVLQKLKASGDLKTHSMRQGSKKGRQHEVFEVKHSLNIADKINALSKQAYEIYKALEELQKEAA